MNASTCISFFFSLISDGMTQRFKWAGRNGLRRRSKSSELEDGVCAREYRGQCENDSVVNLRKSATILICTTRAKRTCKSVLLVSSPGKSCPQ